MGWVDHELFERLALKGEVQLDLGDLLPSARVSDLDVDLHGLSRGEAAGRIAGRREGGRAEGGAGGPSGAKRDEDQRRSADTRRTWHGLNPVRSHDIAQGSRARRTRME